MSITDACIRQGLRISRVPSVCCCGGTEHTEPMREPGPQRGCQTATSSPPLRSLWRKHVTSLASNSSTPDLCRAKRRREAQIQADGPRPVHLPMGLGYVDGVTHDYIHHGTTTLFVALVSHRCGDTRVAGQASAPRVPQLPAKDRKEGTHEARSAPDRRQLMHPQASQSEGLVGAPAPLSSAQNTYL
jgi:hypothetical protein